jgi:hypothetical protein
MSNYENIDISNLVNTDFNTTPIQQINNDLNNNFQQNQQYSQNNTNYDSQIPQIMNIPQDEKIQNMFEENNYKQNLIKYIKKILLILIIYVIFSLEPVKLIIGKYIKYINPNDQGNISIIGFITYGLIIAIIIVLIEKFLL